MGQVPPYVTPLEKWLYAATSELCPASVDAIWTEIKTHFDAAVDDGIRDGLSHEAAQVRALKNLGDAKDANLRFRASHLTRNERKQLNLYTDFLPEYLRWTILVVQLGLTVVMAAKLAEGFAECVQAAADGMPLPLFKALGLTCGSVVFAIWIFISAVLHVGDPARRRENPLQIVFFNFSFVLELFILLMVCIKTDLFAVAATFLICMLLFPALRNTVPRVSIALKIARMKPPIGGDIA
jgi:hypothetical protein